MYLWRVSDEQIRQQNDDGSDFLPIQHRSKRMKCSPQKVVGGDRQPEDIADENDFVLSNTMQNEPIYKMSCDCRLNLKFLYRNNALVDATSKGTAAVGGATSWLGSWVSSFTSVFRMRGYPYGLNMEDNSNNNNNDKLSIVVWHAKWKMSGCVRLHVIRKKVWEFIMYIIFKNLKCLVCSTWASFGYLFDVMCQYVQLVVCCLSQMWHGVKFTCHSQSERIIVKLTELKEISRHIILLLLLCTSINKKNEAEQRTSEVEL